MQYEVNDQGDIVAVVVDGERTLFDPASFGWLVRGGKNDVGDERRSLAALAAIPGFEIAVSPLEALRPGPRPSRSPSQRQWLDGQAPPAVLMSRGGKEAEHGGRQSTSAYFDRLTEAVGQAARSLPGSPASSPMVIYDHIGGRRISITFTPPAVSPGGNGLVYLLDDGFGIKIGWTSTSVAERISGLQTGNPRPITEVAAIADAGPDVEAHLHGQLGELHLSGEWYEREPILAEAAVLGGIGAWLHSLLPNAAWDITVYPPHR